MRAGRTLGKGWAKGASDAPQAIIGQPTSSLMALKGTVTVFLELRGGRSIASLVEKLSEIDGVSAVHVGEAGLMSD